MRGKDAKMLYGFIGVEFFISFVFLAAFLGSYECLFRYARDRPELGIDSI